MTTSTGFMIYTTTVFDENKKDVLYSGQLEAPSLPNAMEAFIESVEKTPPDNIIGSWIPDHGLPTRLVRVETNGLGLEKEVSIGIRLIDTSQQES